MVTARVVLATVVLAASALSACTGDGAPPGPSAASTAPSATAPTATTSGSPGGATPTTTASASTGPSSSSPRPTAPPSRTSPSPGRPPGFATAAKQGGAAPSPASLLRVIRTGRHSGYERVVIEFTGPAPAYQVSYLDAVREDPSDRPVALEGDAFLLVVLSGGTLDTTPQVTDLTKARSYTGPRRIRPDLDEVEEIAAAGDFEGVLSFGIGIDERAPFRVLRLSSPGRIAVDVTTS